MFFRKHKKAQNKNAGPNFGGNSSILRNKILVQVAVSISNVVTLATTGFNPQ
jgi:hypothetical protein